MAHSISARRIARLSLFAPLLLGASEVSAAQQLPAPQLLVDIETGPAAAPPGAALGVTRGRIGEALVTETDSAGCWMTRLTDGSSFQLLQPFVASYVGGCEFDSGGGLAHVVPQYGGISQLYPFSDQGLGLSPLLVEGLCSLGYCVTSDPFAWGDEGWFTSGLGGSAVGTPSIGGLWKSDGTPEGTVEVEAFPYIADTEETRFALAGGALFVWDGELLRSVAGPTGGSLPLTASTSIGSVRFLREFDGAAWFGAVLQNGAEELWSSDGTVAGTVRRFPGPGDPAPTRVLDLASDANRLWLQISTAGLGNELWSVAAGSATPSLVRDLEPGPGSGATIDGSGGSVTFGALLDNGSLVFAGSSGGSGVEPYVSDGTAPGTFRLADIVPGVGSGFPGFFASAGARVVFAASTPATGQELWATDGTLSGTSLIADTRPGPSSGTNFVFAFGDAVGLDVLSDDGAKLWTTDGTPGGTGELGDFVSGPPNASSSPRAFVRHGSELFFQAETVTSGPELWATDGSAAGTRQVADVVPGPAGSNAEPLLSLGERLLFERDTFGSAPALFATKGTAADTELLAGPAVLPGIQSLSDAHRAGPVAVFAGDLAGVGVVLARTDGTPFGTEIFTPNGIGIGASGSGPAFNDVGVLGRQVLFTAEAPGSGRELWTTDGTSVGTSQLIDLWPGAEDSQPSEFTRVGREVYFVAGDPTAGRELWRTDGTVAGTTRVVDLTPGVSGSALKDLTPVSGRLLFLREISFFEGSEVWVTDGTAAGTELVLDEGVRGAERIGDRVLLSKFDGVSSDLLWVTDGTLPGTLPLALGPVTGGSFGDPVAGGTFGDPVAVGRDGDFVSLVSSSSVGLELARYDAGAGAFQLFEPLQPGPASSVDTRALELGGRLFLGGRAPTFGAEPVVVDLADLGEYGIDAFGQGCSMGVEPELDGAGSLRPGDGFELRVEVATPGQVTLFFTASVPLLASLGDGCMLYLANPVLRGSALADGAGSAALSIAVPNDPALVGLRLTAQSLSGEPGGPLLGAFALSNGLDLVIGA